MISPLNNANWSGPNAAGMGGTPAPNVTQSASGLHDTVYTGPGAQGNDGSIAGPNAAEANAIPALTVTDTGTVWV